MSQKSTLVKTAFKTCRHRKSGARYHPQAGPPFTAWRSVDRLADMGRTGLGKRLGILHRTHQAEQQVLGRIEVATDGFEYRLLVARVHVAVDEHGNAWVQAYASSTISTYVIDPEAAMGAIGKGGFAEHAEAALATDAQLGFGMVQCDRLIDLLRLCLEFVEIAVVVPAAGTNFDEPDSRFDQAARQRLIALRGSLPEATAPARRRPPFRRCGW